MYGVKLSLISGQTFSYREGIKNGYDNNNSHNNNNNEGKDAKNIHFNLFHVCYKTLVATTLANNKKCEYLFDGIAIQRTYKFVYNVEQPAYDYTHH